MYPSDSLTVITPIVFFVLLVLFPVIGVFAGWKRSAYWGAGNLLVYIIGLIIWKSGGSLISQGFSNLIISILGEKATSLDYKLLLNSVVTPLFFAIIMLSGNIVLVICYYTFAKRLMGIGRYDKSKHSQKDKKHKGATKVVAQTKSGKVHVANTKWFNMVVGGVGLTALMLPITLSTTHLVTVVTTSSETRKTNSFTTGMYDGLQSLSNGMSWFSYYNGDVTGRDYDGLFNIIDMYAVTITYKDAFDQEQISNEVKALTDVLNEGFNNLINKTLDESITTKTKEAVEPLVKSINNLVTSWDSIITQCKDNVRVILNSPGITTLIHGLIVEATGSISVNNDEIKERFSNVDSIFNKFVEAYKQGKIVLEDGTEIVINQTENTIEISQDTYDQLVDTIFSLYDTSELTSENIDILKEKTYEQLQMIFSVK